MNQKEEIRKELNEYLDKYIPRTETDIYKHVVNFIKKDRKEQLRLHGVSQQSELLAFVKEVSELHYGNGLVEITKKAQDLLKANCG